MNESFVLISDNSSSRKVYDLGDGNILKVPRNERGRMECHNEWAIYKSVPEWVIKQLCPVIDYDEATGSITMKKIKPLTKDDNFEELTPNREELIQHLITNYDLDEFDLDYYFNWGVDEEGNVLILDYGNTYCADYIKKP